ncbi:MAG: prepilin-type N-terminal cleavage/methylation domain-containing protein [Alphaproteobacteria bacterium]|nr:prepilin-type N-terminal cleavage/methylation domain-containing protein [Alphaproteobacteria bacterium]
MKSYPKAIRLRPDANAAGFTLIEVLVVLGLLGFMSLLVFSALRISASVWTSTEYRSEASADVGVVQSFLRRLLEQAYPALVRQDDGRVIIAFRGMPESIELSAPMSSGAALGGFQRVRIDSTANGRLLASWRPERNEPGFGAAPSGQIETELLTGMSAFRLGYFGQAEGATTPAWRNDWIEQKALPRLISVEIAFADHRRSWPRMLVAPAVDVDATCVFDPLTRGCRGR